MKGRTEAHDSQAAGPAPPGTCHAAQVAQPSQHQAPE